jgi:hypothetical protein
MRCDVDELKLGSYNYGGLSKVGPARGYSYYCKWAFLKAILAHHKASTHRTQILYITCYLKNRIKNNKVWITKITIYILL